MIAVDRKHDISWNHQDLSTNLTWNWLQLNQGTGSCRRQLPDNSDNFPISWPFFDCFLEKMPISAFFLFLITQICGHKFKEFYNVIRMRHVCTKLRFSSKRILITCRLCIYNLFVFIEFYIRNNKNNFFSWWKPQNISIPQHLDFDL